MIAAAMEVEPDIEWVLGRAEALPFDDNAFDCVVSQFGMMFFDGRQRAADEMHRVMKAGGRLALSMWHSIDQNQAYEDIVEVLDREVGSAAGDAVRMPFCLGDPDGVATILSQAGFEGIAFESKIESAKFPCHRTMVEVELRGWLPLFGIKLDETEIANVLVKSDAKLSKYTVPSGEAVFPTSAYIMTARKFK